jgi:uncharacterized protein
MQELIIKNISKKVKEIFTDKEGSHDWWHIYRVWKMAKAIAKKENANTLIVEIAALLHDIADWKLTNEQDGLQKAIDIMKNENINEVEINNIIHIIKNVSYKGSKEKDIALNIEGEIVRDADRLDAIGAIGIARTFAYGGSKKRALYLPNVLPEENQNFESYKNNNSHTINHFYEKLLLLKDRMHTNTAKKIAQKRQEIMLNFLDEFMQEWNADISF